MQHIAFFTLCVLALALLTSKFLKLRAYSGVVRVAPLLSALVLDYLFLVAGAAVLTFFGTASVFASLALSFVCVVLSIVVVMEAYYFVRTGSHGDGYLLRQIFYYRRDLLMPIRYEVTRHRFLAVLVVLALISGFGAAGSAWVIPSGRPENSHLTALWIGIAISVMLLGTLAQSSTPNRRYCGERSSTLTSIFRGLFNPNGFSSKGIELEASRRGPLQDSEDLGRLFSPPESKSIALRHKPNVIVVVLESVRDLSRLPRGTMPYLESLKSAYSYVETFTCVMPHTTKALVPILCGRYPAVSWRVTPRYLGLPQLFADQGYSTGFFTPAELSFEGKDLLLKSLGFQHQYGASDMIGGKFPRTHYLGYPDQALTAPALEWVSARTRGNQPFFLTLLTLSSHHPYRAPGRSLVEGPGSDFHSYLQALRYADSCLEELFEALRTRGILDNTCWFIVGDHGQAFGEHLRRYHSAALWEEVLHVPCIFSVPPGLQQPPKVVAGVRSQMDIVPTLLDILDNRIGPEAARSLLRDPIADRVLFHATWIEHQSLCMRKGTHKFIYHYRRELPELYDLALDPLEQANLAARLSRSEIHELETECLIWRKRSDYAY